ncbi:MAG: hypothetical protein V4508_14405 [Pseudomonadota bacterium]
MNQITRTTHPSHAAVRAHLERRRTENTPPPAPATIREQLGWWLIPANDARSDRG